MIEYFSEGVNMYVIASFLALVCIGVIASFFKCKTGKLIKEFSEFLGAIVLALGDKRLTKEETQLIKRELEDFMKVLKKGKSKK